MGFSNSFLLASRTRLTHVRNVQTQLMPKHATPHFHNQPIEFFETISPICACKIRWHQLKIQAQPKQNPATAKPNWQIPVTFLPARIEPVPGVAAFIITQDHARSRLNRGADGKGIGGQLK